MESNFFNHLDANYFYYNSPNWEEEMFPAFPKSLEQYADVADKRFENENSKNPIFKMGHALNNVNNEYDITLKKDYLNKFKKNPRNFIGTATEELVLGKLGYDLKDYQNRRVVIEKVQQIVEEKLNSKEIEFQSLSSLKIEMKELVLQERFKAAGVSPDHVKHIQSIVRGIWNYRKKFDEQAKPSTSLQSLQGSCEIAAKICSSKKMGLISKLKRDEIDIFIKENRKKLIAMFNEKEAGEFQEILEQLINYSFNDPRTSAFRKDQLENLEGKIPELRWFNKYQDTITVQFSQGLQSDDETLDGICCALTHRFIKKVLENPTCADTDMGLDEILPNDRFMQAAHQLMKLKNANEHTWSFPGTLSKDYPEQPSVLCYIQNLKNILTNLEGVIKVHLSINTPEDESGGHALGIQIDRQNRIFRFHDANLGVVRIKTSDTESPEVAVKKLAEAFKDYIACFYPETVAIVPLLTNTASLVFYE